MLPFEVILFDVGGVLLTNGWDHLERALVVDRFKLDQAAFEARHAQCFDAWERDQIPVRDYLDATVFYEPRDFTRDDFVSAIFAQSAVLPDGALSILEELAASGKWILGALNNEPREPNEYRFEHFGLRRYFDVALSSCFLGLRKPEPAMYKRALDILGGSPGRILFIDDRQGNVDAAAAAGMQAIRFNGADKLRRDLATLGIL